jgi:hypothetical protein
MTPEASKVLEFQTLVDYAAKLHEEISAKDKELKEIKKKLAEKAEFKEGSKTGHVFGVRWHATVALKEAIKWDQDALRALRLAIGDEDFFKIFKFIYEPVSKKALDGAIDFGLHGEDIKKAFTITPGSPQVTFKPMEDH